MYHSKTELGNLFFSITTQKLLEKDEKEKKGILRLFMKGNLKTDKEFTDEIIDKIRRIYIRFKLKNGDNSKDVFFYRVIPTNNLRHGDGNRIRFLITECRYNVKYNSNLDDYIFPEISKIHFCIKYEKRKRWMKHALFEGNKLGTNRFELKRLKKRFKPKIDTNKRFEIMCLKIINKKELNAQIHRKNNNKKTDKL